MLTGLMTESIVFFSLRLFSCGVPTQQLICLNPNLSSSHLCHVFFSRSTRLQLPLRLLLTSLSTSSKTLLHLLCFSLTWTYNTAHKCYLPPLLHLAALVPIWDSGNMGAIHASLVLSIKLSIPQTVSHSLVCHPIQTICVLIEVLHTLVT